MTRDADDAFLERVPFIESVYKTSRFHFYWEGIGYGEVEEKREWCRTFPTVIYMVMSRTEYLGENDLEAVAVQHHIYYAVLGHDDGIFLASTLSTETDASTLY
jgi:hypothetical protein